MKKIIIFFKYIIDTTMYGFYCICLTLSRGFFFYFYLLFAGISKLLNIKSVNNLKYYFKSKQNQPVAFMMLVFCFSVFVFFHAYLYTSDDDIVYVDSMSVQEITKKDNDNSSNNVIEETPVIDNNKEEKQIFETNLYRKYGSISINNINFQSLKSENNDVVAWITVDSTNINYPVVQTDNNDYYLNHDFLKRVKVSGWTFMDFRNSKNMEDDNTIFYGHNLLNKTSFGSISNIFTDKWFNSSNHQIIVLTEEKRYVYQIFSNYYIDPEVYYLQNNFYSDEDYNNFLNTIKSRSLRDYGIELNSNDKIITLSTCTDDNKGRKVVHAKLITN